MNVPNKKGTKTELNVKICEAKITNAFAKLNLMPIYYQKQTYTHIQSELCTRQLYVNVVVAHFFFSFYFSGHRQREMKETKKINRDH